MRAAVLCLSFTAACDGVLLSPPPAQTKERAIAKQQEVAADGTTLIVPERGDDGRYVCDDQIYPARVDMRRLTTAQYRNVIRDLFAGRVTPSDDYPGAFGKSESGFSTEAEVNAMSEQGAEQTMLAAESVAEQVAAVLPQLLPCAAQANEACARTFVTLYAARAFRRPLAAEETSTLVQAYLDGRASGASFTEAIAMTTVVLLQSPQFLYLNEGYAAPYRQLDGYEVATRLSFTLWDSLPDDALLAAVATLADRNAVAAQARRMLADPKAAPAIARFYREWTETKTLAAADKDDPTFDAATAAAVNASFDHFVTQQTQAGGTLSTLLTSTDGALPARYEASQFYGLLTHPALLASHAHTSTSSYVFRGRVVRKRLLCDVIAPPPPTANAELATIALPTDPTGKEVSAAINARSQCTGCHALMDPAGLALEHFDATGKWRERYESGRPIDPSGTLPSVDDHGITFGDHRALIVGLAGEARVATCFQRQLVRFAVSRMDDKGDACAVQRIGDALAASNGRLDEAMVAMTTTDAFLYRQE